MNHQILLIIHLICLSIWVGGHLFLAIRILPNILKEKSAEKLFTFGESFEPLGMGALVLIVTTGVWMAIQMGVTPSTWFHFASPIEKVVSTKLALLAAMLLLALSVRLRINPTLKDSPKKLPELAVHIILINLISLTMLVMGTVIRYGGF